MKANIKCERWMTIRVYPNLLHTVGAWTMDGKNTAKHARPFTEEDIENWIKKCSEYNATAVLWQSNNGGLSTHPSPVFPLAGPPLREHNEAYTPVWKYLGDQLRRFDNLNVTIRLCHEYGLRFVYAFCPCDFVGSPFEQSMFHPKLWMLSRSGEPFHGVPCYAEPETLKIVLTHLRDVLDRGVDDLAISPFSHLQAQGTDQPGYYGFNPPLVEAYRQRYGKDPRLFIHTPDNLFSLYGDFYTDFLRKLKRETVKLGQRLVACTSYSGRWGWGGTGGWQIFNHCNTGASAPTVAPACGIEYKYKQWCEERLVDALMVIAPPQKTVPIAKDISRQTGVPVLLWHKISPTTTPGEWKLYDKEAAEVKRENIHGLVVHGTVIVAENKLTLKLWDLLKSAS